MLPHDAVSQERVCIMSFLTRLTKAYKGRVQSRSITVNVAALTAAAVSQVIADPAGDLPAGAVVVGRQVNLTEVFAGGGASSAVFDAGGTDDNAVIAAEDVFTGATLGKKSGTDGVLPTGVFGGETLGVKVTSDVDVNTLTTGAAVVTFWFVLPS
jgi:hypothetical protein